MKKNKFDDRHELKRICANCDKTGEFSIEVMRLGFANLTHGICKEHYTEQLHEIGCTQKEVNDAINDVLEF